jgi:hypothetical protein
VIIIDKMYKLFKLVSVGVIFILPISIAPSVFAASASLSLSPASGNESQGGTFSIGIYEDSGADTVNAASIDLTYPNNLLSYESTSSSSAFNITAATSGGNGSVHIDRGALPAVSGRQLIASVRFKALSGSGTANLSFENDSKVVSSKSSSNILLGKSGAVFTLQGSSSSSSNKAPAINEVNAIATGARSIVITWTTSAPSTSEVDYGLTSGYGFASDDGALVTQHKVTLNASLLQGGTQYHYVVKSADSAGHVTTGKDQTITTQGAVLRVSVVDQNGKAVSGAKVTIGSSTVITNSSGGATLENLPTGQGVAKVDYKGSRSTQTINIEPVNANSVPQSVTLSVHRSNVYVWLLFLLLLLLLCLIMVSGSKKKRAKYRSIISKR